MNKIEKKRNKNTHYVVYILRCRDDTLYTGITNDLTKRFRAHQANLGAKYTRGRTPVTLVYSEFMMDKGKALSRECEIKQMTREEKILLIESRIREEE